MTDSQRTMAARVVRVLACLLSVWGILLLLDPAKNDVVGYALLVIGPIFMLAARWIDPPVDSADPEDIADENASSGTSSNDSG